MSFYVTTSITSTPHTHSHTHYSFLFFCFKSKVTLLVPHSPIVLYHSHIQRQHKFSSLPILIFNFTHIYLFLTTNGPILVEINPHPQPSLLPTTIFVSLYLYIIGTQFRLLVDSVSIPVYPSILYSIITLSALHLSSLLLPPLLELTHTVMWGYIYRVGVGLVELSSTRGVCFVLHRSSETVCTNTNKILNVPTVVERTLTSRLCCNTTIYKTSARS